MAEVEDSPEPCPECGRVALLPVRAAEMPGPLLYLCANCQEAVSVDVYERWIARQREMHPEQLTSEYRQPHRLTWKERILGGYRVH